MTNLLIDAIRTDLSGARLNGCSTLRFRYIHNAEIAITIKFEISRLCFCEIGNALTWKGLHPGVLGVPQGSAFLLAMWVAGTPGEWR